MPSAPITSPESSRSGMRLTTKVPALLVSRSTRIGLPLSTTWRMRVLGTTSSTGRPTKSSARSKPSAGRNFLYESLIHTTRPARSTSIIPCDMLENSSNMDCAASLRMLSEEKKGSEQFFASMFTFAPEKLL